MADFLTPDSGVSMAYGDAGGSGGGGGRRKKPKLWLDILGS